MDRQMFKTGQIFWYEERLSSEVINYLKSCGLTVGSRPVIVYRNIDIQSDGVTIIPLTSMRDDKHRNGVKLCIDEGIESMALCTEIRNVPMNSLKQFIGNVSDAKMSEINSVVSLYLGIRRDYDGSSPFNDNIQIRESYKIKYDIHRWNEKEQTKETKQQEFGSRTPYFITPPAPKEESEESGEKVKIKRAPCEDRKDPYCERRTHDSFSIIELGWLKLSSYEDIMKRYDCAYSTARCRKILANEHIPGMLSECKELYEYFKDKRIKSLDDYEFLVFSKLNAGHLSKIFNISISEVLKHQKSR